VLAQTLQIADAVGGPGMGVAVDTFHMNMEEKDTENRTVVRAASIRRTLAPSQDGLATRGLSFLRAKSGAAA
jgi:hypothetical protein